MTVVCAIRNGRGMCYIISRPARGNQVGRSYVKCDYVVMSAVKEVLQYFPMRSTIRTVRIWSPGIYSAVLYSKVVLHKY